MSMTLWIHTLEGRVMSQDSDDYSLMHRFADELDVLCAGKGLPALSSFFDFTDLNYNMDDEFDEDGEGGEDGEQDSEAGDDQSAEDPETGLGYGIDDMQWFDATTGLHAISEVRDALKEGSLESLEPAQRADLIGELDSCLSVLQSTSKRAGKFHLAVIM